MPKRNIVSWSAFMAGLFFTRLAFQVLGLFLNRVLEENMCLNEYTLAIVISCCSISGKLDLGKQFHRRGDVIQSSSPFNSTKEPSGFINEDSIMFMLNDWACKFEGKVNKVLVLRAIKQWGFLKGYGMKDCKLLGLRESVMVVACV
ncbi:hypothetical protein LguiB_013179 [Lonicera macranthoides]